MGAIAQFNYATWALLFPQFSALTQNQIETLVLPIAEGYCPNDGSGPATTTAMQANMLNLMVAHVAQLLFGANDQSPSPLVGRINSATEGSVSVGVDFPVTPANAWYMQTPFGAMYWTLTAPYRTMRYRPGPVRTFGPFPYADGWPWPR